MLKKHIQAFQEIDKIDIRQEGSTLKKKMPETFDKYIYTGLHNSLSRRPKNCRVNQTFSAFIRPDYPTEA